MPELRENAELPAKGIHIHTSLIPIFSIGQVPIRSSGTGCIGCAFFFSACCWHWAPGFLLSYGTPQQTSKQEENKHGVGGCLILLQFTITLVTHRLSAGLQSAAVILGSVAFSLPISQGASQNLDRERRAHRVRAVHSPARISRIVSSSPLTRGPRSYQGQHETYTHL